TNKYDLGEISCYCSPNDPRRSSIAWKNYPNLPHEGNQDEINMYNSSPEAQFGSWRYEQYLLDFLPDVCFSITDTWMHAHMHESPYRPLYNLTICPTVDSYPQNVD